MWVKLFDACLLLVWCVWGLRRNFRGVVHFIPRKTIPCTQVLTSRFCTYMHVHPYSYRQTVHIRRYTRVHACTHPMSFFVWIYLSFLGKESTTPMWLSVWLSGQEAIQGTEVLSPFPSFLSIDLFLSYTSPTGVRTRMSMLPRRQKQSRKRHRERERERSVCQV